jgi:hypothetical protein
MSFIIRRMSCHTAGSQLKFLHYFRTFFGFDLLSGVSCSRSFSVNSSVWSQEYNRFQPLQIWDYFLWNLCANMGTFVLFCCLLNYQKSLTAADQSFYQLAFRVVTFCLSRDFVACIVQSAMLQDFQHLVTPTDVSLSLI